MRGIDYLVRRNVKIMAKSRSNCLVYGTASLVIGLIGLIFGIRHWDDLDSVALLGGVPPSFRNLHSVVNPQRFGR